MIRSPEAVNLEGEVFATGDRKVPLVNGMIVLDAAQQGRDLPLEHEANSHSAVLTGPADFAITLNAALPLMIETGRASFTLPAPRGRVCATDLDGSRRTDADQPVTGNCDVPVVPEWTNRHRSHAGSGAERYFVVGLALEHELSLPRRLAKCASSRTSIL